MVKKDFELFLQEVKEELKYQIENGMRNQASLVGHVFEMITLTAGQKSEFRFTASQLKQLHDLPRIVTKEMSA